MSPRRWSMAPAVVDATTDQRRRMALASLTCAATKTLLAIRCAVPGRAIPTNKICVDDQVRLRDVVAAWAEGVMKSKDGEIPAAARVMGSKVKALDLDATLRALRPQLPVRDGRLTILVVWPDQTPEPAVGAPKPASQTAANPRPALGSAADAQSAGPAKDQSAAAKDRAQEKAAVARQKAQERAQREKQRQKALAKKEKQRLRERAKKEKRASKEKAKKARTREEARRAKEDAREADRRERAEARAKRKAAKEEAAAESGGGKEGRAAGTDGRKGCSSSGSSGSSSDSSGSSDCEDAPAISRFLSDISGGE